MRSITYIAVLLIISALVKGLSIGGSVVTNDQGSKVQIVAEGNPCTTTVKVAVKSTQKLEISFKNNGIEQFQTVSKERAEILFDKFIDSYNKLIRTREKLLECAATGSELEEELEDVSQLAELFEIKVYNQVVFHRKCCECWCNCGNLFCTKCPTITCCKYVPKKYRKNGQKYKKKPEQKKVCPKKRGFLL